MTTVYHMYRENYIFWRWLFSKPEITIMTNIIYVLPLNVSMAYENTEHVKNSLQWEVMMTPIKLSLHVSYREILFQTIFCCCLEVCFDDTFILENMQYWNRDSCNANKRSVWSLEDNQGLKCIYEWGHKNSTVWTWLYFHVILQLKRINKKYRAIFSHLKRTFLN